MFQLAAELNEILSPPQQKNLGEIRQLLREAPLEESRKRELSSALHVYFKDWLYGNCHSFSSMPFLFKHLAFTSTRNTVFQLKQIFMSSLANVLWRFL